MKIRPEEGLEVVVTGRLTTYPGRSNYQIVIETLEPAGVGALLKQLEERKKKLAAEGLFDEARKQLIPFMPRVIGVVTSPTGAVIRDILHRLADRFPRDVIVWPVRVQGDGAANEIAAAIRGFNALPEGGRIRRPDVLIVARGGGSLEDLWCFNEEIVVRAAADSMIPLISAVGHETDITLIDFAVRPPRADADRGRRNGGAGARRTAVADRGARRAPDRLLAARPRNPQARIALARARVADAPIGCSPIAGSVSTICPNGCRARCAPMRMCIISNSRASPDGCRRSSCARGWSAAMCWSNPSGTRGKRAYATYLARRSDRVRIRRSIAQCVFLSRRARAAASRWCAIRRACRCARRRRSRPACGSISNFPTAASARPPMAQAVPAASDSDPSRKPKRGGRPGQGSLF